MVQTFDLVGSIEHTVVPVSLPLLPLFEAISNAVDAIHERAVGKGEITVSVTREPSQGQLELDRTSRAQPRITGFTVSDDGIGFTDAHVTSFLTRYSRQKAPDGGKGLGRFAWFKTFDSVEIVSHFLADGEMKARTWKYESGDTALREWRDTAPTKATPGTVVDLKRFRRDYEARTPKRLETIAYRVLEHFLSYHVLDKLPSIRIEETEGERDFEAATVYSELIVKSESGSCAVEEGLELSVRYLLLKHHSELPAGIAYCAKGRIADFHAAVTVLPDVPDSFAGENGELMSFRAYVSGALLEANVDPNRSGFRFDEGTPKQQRLFPELPSWLNIRDALRPGCEAFIGPHIAASRTSRDDRVDRYVEDAPWYRGLLAARPDVKTRIPVNAGNEAIEMGLYRETLHWRGDVHKRGAQLLEELKSEGDDFDAVREKLWEHQNSLKTSALDDLARYVYHRRAVLHWLEKYLAFVENQRADGKQAHVAEEVVHDLFFRRGTDSSTQGYFAHNLWVIDDQLTFHQYAASDLSLSSHKGHRINSRREPDVVSYSRAIFTERDDEDAQCRSVVIVEFKKPGRLNYGGKEDPIQQVRTYAELIATRARKAEDGRTIEVGAGTKYFGYVIADPSPELNDVAKHYSMRPLPNGSGWSRHFVEDEPRLYLEMMTYTQALAMAKRRNAAFFHLLGVRGTKG